MPVILIGGVTVLIFFFIIITSQKRPPTSEPELIEANAQELIAPHTYVKGPFDAPITLVEFTDFGCPACKSYHPIVKALLEEYPEQIRWGVRHFPLPSHKNAEQAAMAAQAAGEQNKFWEYADILFENQNKFSEGDLLGYADFLGMDVEKFKQDYDNPTIEDLVTGDVTFGRKIGINATPTFFINGKQVRPAGLDDFRNLIDEQLAAGNQEGAQEQEVQDTTTDEQPIEKEAPPAEPLTFIHQTIDQRFGTLEIAFSDEGFSPRNTQGYAGQKVVWTNNTSEDFTFVQLMPRYEELSEPFLVEAGETFEFRFALRKSGLWTYKNEGSSTRASVFVNKLPPDLEQLLPDN